MLFVVSCMVAESNNKVSRILFDMKIKAEPRPINTALISSNGTAHNANLPANIRAFLAKPVKLKSFVASMTSETPTIMATAAPIIAPINIPVSTMLSVFMSAMLKTSLPIAINAAPNPITANPSKSIAGIIIIILKARP